MLYISKNDAYIILSNAGKTLYQFFNGQLCVGDPTTKSGAANVIDFSLSGTTPEKSVMAIFPTDLSGATTDRAEMCGLGASNPAAPDEELLFIEAPILTATAGSVAAVANTPYLVLHGTVTYNGTTYLAGETFIADGTITATTGTGQFRLTFIDNECACNRKEAFKMKHLQVGDEVTQYHRWDNGGYTERDGMTEGEEISNGVGYIRGST